MKVVAEFSIIPIGVGVSLSKYIAECERILNAKHLTIELHAQGTNIEGEFDEVIAAMKECIEAVHKLGVSRIITNIKINTRVDKTESMKTMVESVEQKI